MKTISTRRPDLKFYRTGQTHIGKRVSNALGIESGDVVSIAYNNGEYLLYIAHKAKDVIGSHNGTVRKDYRCSYATWSKKLWNFMVEAVGEEPASGVMKFVTGPVVEADGLGKAMPIITRRLL